LKQSKGSHVYRFTVLSQPYRTQRISIAITVAGHTKRRIAPITVSR
jgi:hypothetical protein